MNPYLGAIDHVEIMSEDGERYVHHPMNNETSVQKLQFSVCSRSTLVLPIKT